MQEPIETIIHNGLTIKIEPDTDASSPREDDNLGTIVGWHSRYKIGDEQPKCTPEEFLLGLARDADSDFEEIEDRLDSIHRQAWRRHNESSLTTKADAFFAKRRDSILDDNYVLLPVHMYDHGGIKLSTGSFSCPWDSGQVGYVYVSKDDVVKEYGEWTAESVAKATKCLEFEIEAYSSYLNGDVYGFVIEDDEGEIVDSCWGFYEIENCIKQAKEAADTIASHRAKLELSDASCGAGI